MALENFESANQNQDKSLQTGPSLTKSEIKYLFFGGPKPGQPPVSDTEDDLLKSLGLNASNSLSAYFFGVEAADQTTKSPARKATESTADDIAAEVDPPKLLATVLGSAAATVIDEVGKSGVMRAAEAFAKESASALIDIITPPPVVPEDEIMMNGAASTNLPEPDDTSLQDLIKELNRGDQSFRRWFQEMQQQQPSQEFRKHSLEMGEVLISGAADIIQGRPVFPDSENWYPDR